MCPFFTLMAQACPFVTPLRAKVFPSFTLFDTPPPLHARRTVSASSYAPGSPGAPRQAPLEPRPFSSTPALLPPRSAHSQETPKDLTPVRATGPGYGRNRAVVLSRTATVGIRPESCSSSERDRVRSYFRKIRQLCPAAAMAGAGTMETGTAVTASPAGPTLVLTSAAANLSQRSRLGPGIDEPRGAEGLSSGPDVREEPIASPAFGWPGNLGSDRRRVPIRGLAATSTNAREGPLIDGLTGISHGGGEGKLIRVVVGG